MANQRSTLITSTVRNALHTKNSQNSIAIIPIAKNIHRLPIPASLAFIQSINKKTPLAIAPSQSSTTAIEAMNSHISGIQRRRNQKMNVIIETIKRIFL
jgi:hypothetical protein